MYILVTNIPDGFHTPELRNFFFEMIESGAFNCFHFRHRPHSNLMSLLKKESSDTLPLSESQELSETSESSSGSCSKQLLSSDLSVLKDLIKEKKQKLYQMKGHTNLSQEIQYRNRSIESEDSCMSSQNIETRLQSHVIDGQQNTSNVKVSDTIEPNIFEVLKSADGKCCIIEIKDEFVEKFQCLYHKKLWINRKGDVIPQRCLIVDLHLDSISSEFENENDYMTRQEIAQQGLKTLDLKNMIEFHPPSIMPNGNIGTPTQHFQDLIRSCQLPGTIITKLGLQFPRHRRKRRFDQVPYDYGTEVCFSKNEENQEKYIAFTAAGDLIPTSVDSERPQKRHQRKLEKSGPKLELENESEDGAEVEEWERYETFHEDVTKQGRIKERLYEKEIELVWEKGGPGLVFYTDAQYWREQEGDFDEQTADEWDVDMSVYYDKGAGDFDARSTVQMIDSDNLRSGAITESAFKSTKKCPNISNTKKPKNEARKIRQATGPPKIGKFEAHTRGFGRRLMESQGWTDGVGLGRKEDGLPYALDNDGQNPQDKKGFGYHGEKLEGWGKPSSSSSKQSFSSSSSGQDDMERIRIRTVFDAPNE